MILSATAANAQFIQNSARSLFSDVKAFKEGDAIMVLIMEETQADNAATTSEDREHNIGGGLNINTGSGNSTIDLGFNSGSDFQGRGRTSRTERIKSRLSARVVEVDDNGNLRIEGKRTTQINGETQTITIQGLVRPVDVRHDNSVYSYSILDLTLIIDGVGVVTDTQEPGLITKFLRFLF